MNPKLVNVHNKGMWFALIMVITQFATAGLMVFPGLMLNGLDTYYGFHAIPGFLVILSALSMLIVGLIGRVGKVTNTATAALFVLAVAQMFLAHAPRMIAALHVFNALVLFVMTHELARGRFRAPTAVAAKATLSEASAD